MEKNKVLQTMLENKQKSNILSGPGYSRINEELIEVASKEFCNKQNQSKNKVILNCWDDMTEEMKNEIRIAIQSALGKYTEEISKKYRYF
jgi:exopolysaccharide biosynthesis predicted pyruvyltransferase EpsI